MFWTVNIDGVPNQSGNAAVAVVVGDKIYSFGDYNCPNPKAMIGSMDVLIIQTDNYKWGVLKHANTSSNEIPCRRYGHSAVVHNDLVYIWGGSGNDEAFNDLFCFDTKTHLWSKPTVSGTLPAPRIGHSACVINDSMYIFAGFEEHSKSEDFSPQFYRDVYKLDLYSFKWSYVHTTGVAPMYRYKHSATVINNCMFIFGGLGHVGPHYSNNEKEIYWNEIIYLDMQTLSWIYRPDLNGLYRPVGRAVQHSCFCYKDQLFIFGGYNGLQKKHYNDLIRFDPQSCCWSVVETRGKRPCARDGTCCCLIGDRVFMFSGLSPVPSTSESGFPRLVCLRDLHVLDFAPSLKTLAITAVLEHKLDRTSLPETIQHDIKTMARRIFSNE